MTQNTTTTKEDIVTIKSSETSTTMSKKAGDLEHLFIV